MDRKQAVATTLIDDNKVRVTRFEFDSSAETGWHRHEHDYVITAITDCHMLLEEPNGEARRTIVTSGESYRRDKGVEHNVINDGKEKMIFIEVELK